LIFKLLNAKFFRSIKVLVLDKVLTLTKDFYRRILRKKSKINLEIELIIDGFSLERFENKNYHPLLQAIADEKFEVRSVIRKIWFTDIGD